MGTAVLKSQPTSDLRILTGDWENTEQVTLYLDRCQVDTPHDLVKTVWDQIVQRRTKIGKVVDFGAGDGRFALHGPYDQYIGYEIDVLRRASPDLPSRAEIIHRCAFAEPVSDADLCIGNPPYVRNQDLPDGWRERAAKRITEQTGVKISGLANAWQYFFLLGMASTNEKGLVALIIPYEWVSRPSSRAIRDYIKKQRWRVSVYRLLDDTFPRVLTTSSITIVDKACSDSRCEYFQQTEAGQFRTLSSLTASSRPLLQYRRMLAANRDKEPYAKRGLSPGTQKVLTLTEPERARLGLQIGRDVVPCVTTMRNLPLGTTAITKAVFKKRVR